MLSFSNTQQQGFSVYVLVYHQLKTPGSDCTQVLLPVKLPVDILTLPFFVVVMIT